MFWSLFSCLLFFIELKMQNLPFTRKWFFAVQFKIGNSIPVSNLTDTHEPLIAKGHFDTIELNRSKGIQIERHQAMKDSKEMGLSGPVRA